MGEKDGRNWFRVVGLVTNPHFQKCRCIVEKLAKSYPNDYREPEIRSMLNVDWIEYIKKVRRKIGGRLFALQKPVAVFYNGAFLGDDVDLDKFIAATYRFTISRNFELLGVQELYKLLQEHLDKGRQLAYITIAIDGKMIGTMLFVLYSDMVPKTCENFLKRCENKKNGYLGKFVHRIAKPSWIQAGGYHLKEKRMPCENYTVFHDRRGVLSMTNYHRHKENSTQFHVALNPSSWMDYRYVGFGQLLHGDEVLQQIEDVPTIYEAPQKIIRIVKCGEFKFKVKKDKPEVQKELPPCAIQPTKKKESESEISLPEKPSLTIYDDPKEPDITFDDIHQELRDDRDLDSLLYEDRYNAGYYSLKEDLKCNLPFLHLPDYIILALLREQEQCEGECNDFQYPKEVLLRHLESLKHADSIVMQPPIEKFLMLTDYEICDVKDEMEEVEGEGDQIKDLWQIEEQIL